MINKKVRKSLQASLLDIKALDVKALAITS